MYIAVPVASAHKGIIEEEVYIEQPEGFVVHGKESHVCKLKKGVIWTQASTSCLVWTNKQIPGESGIHPRVMQTQTFITRL